jgi:hypothetical protein
VRQEDKQKKNRREKNRKHAEKETEKHAVEGKSPKTKTK